MSPAVLVSLTSDTGELVAAVAVAIEGLTLDTDADAGLTVEDAAGEEATTPATPTADQLDEELDVTELCFT